MLVFLAVLPLIVLMAAMIAIYLLRSFRRLNELQAPNTRPADSPSCRRPSDDFHDTTWLPLCSKVAASAELRMNRSLTRAERRAIWRSRTVVVLQATLQALEETPEPEAVATLLAQLPSGLDRPDPTCWCEVATSRLAGGGQ